MRNKGIGVVLAVAIGLGLWFWFKAKHDRLEVIHQQEAKQVTPKPAENPKQPALSSSANSQTTMNSAENEPEPDWTVLGERLYSDDPLVELQSLLTRYTPCHPFVRDMKLQQLEPTAKQQVALEKQAQSCEAMRQRHPFLANRSQLQQLIKQAKAATSLDALGDFYRDEALAATIREDLMGYQSKSLKMSIKAKNAQGMMSVMQTLNTPFIGVDPDLEAVLSGADGDYLRLIQSIAVGVISCEFQNGETCDESSAMMVDLCLTDEAFCGMDFQQWYAQFVTEWQQPDVDLLIAHYQQDGP